MKKIGIYVFTDAIKSRATKKREGYFDGQNYIGLRYIVSEIDKSDWYAWAVDMSTTAGSMAAPCCGRLWRPSKGKLPLLRT